MSAINPPASLYPPPFSAIRSDAEDPAIREMSPKFTATTPIAIAQAAPSPAVIAMNFFFLAGSFLTSDHQSFSLCPITFLSFLAGMRPAKPYTVRH